MPICKGCVRDLGNFIEGFHEKLVVEEMTPTQARLFSLFEMKKTSLKKVRSYTLPSRFRDQEMPIMF